MENARLLDERLRRIIGEVSGRTGGEIKKNLLNEFEGRVRTVLEDLTGRETARFLELFKKAVDQI